MTVMETSLILCVVVSEWHEVELEHDSDGDEPDSAASTADCQLRQLCSRLRRDLKQVLLFTTAECQVVVSSQSLLYRYTADVL